MATTATFSGGQGDSSPPCRFLFVMFPPMMRCDMISFIQENFRYENGVLYRTTSRGGEKIGKAAGWLTVCNGRPYWKININKKTTYLHHVIFLLHHGFLPDYIDHKDGDSTNNKIENLRAATQSQNMANSVMKSSNTSGYKGVTFRKDTKKWASAIMVNGKHISLGSHKTKEDAHAAYVLGAKKYFGEFSRATI
jgi:hypothetical protein